MSVEQAPVTWGTRLRRRWDWFTDLGVGAWLLAGGALAVSALVIAVVVGHGAKANTACADGEQDMAIIASDDGQIPSGAQIGELHLASTRLRFASEAAVGAPKALLAAAARLAASAQPGHVFHAGALPGRLDSACNVGGGPGSGNNPLDRP